MLCIECVLSISGEDFNNWGTPVFASLAVIISGFALYYNKKAFSEVAKQNDLNSNFYIHQLLRKQCGEILEDLQKLDLKTMKDYVHESQREKINGINYMNCYLALLDKYYNPTMAKLLAGGEAYSNIILAKSYTEMNKNDIIHFKELHKTVIEDWLVQLFVHYDRLQNILKGHYFENLDNHQKLDIIDYIENRILIDYTNLYFYEKYPKNFIYKNSKGENVEKDEDDFYLRDIDDEKELATEIYPALEKNGFWELHDLIFGLRKKLKVKI